MEKIRGSRALVLNTLRKNEHISHFTLNEGISIAETLKPESAWFTHLSHQMGLHEEINKELPPGIRLAYDGLVLQMEEE